jgi:hypothetical protein
MYNLNKYRQRMGLTLKKTNLKEKRYQLKLIIKYNKNCFLTFSFFLPLFFNEKKDKKAPASTQADRTF